MKVTKRIIDVERFFRSDSYALWLAGLSDDPGADVYEQRANHSEKVHCTLKDAREEIREKSTGS